MGLNLCLVTALEFAKFIDQNFWFKSENEVWHLELAVWISQTEPV